MELNEGILTIRVKEAKLTRDTEFLGSMSPYCTILHGKNKYKTKVATNAGKTPTWVDEFQLSVNAATEELTLRVWDQDLTTRDAVGFTKLKVSSLMINCGITDWFTIMFDNKPAGQVLFETEFAPKGGNAFEQQEEKY
jgi:Ca2+-dependent lipid-binding protein